MSRHLDIASGHSGIGSPGAPAADTVRAAEPRGTSCFTSEILGEPETTMSTMSTMSRGLDIA